MTVCARAVEYRENSSSSSRGSLSVFLLGGCGHPDLSSSGLPQFRLECIALASTAADAAATTTYKYVWHVTAKCTVYQVMSNSAFATIGSKTWVLGGGQYGGYQSNMSSFDYDTNTVRRMTAVAMRDEGRS